MELPALTREITLDYAAFSLAVPEKVRFRYQLEGHDAAWQDARDRRQAYYRDLAPGRYRFRVVAANNDGVWNEPGAAVEIDIAPAFYQTRAFHVLSAALLGALAWGAYRWRLRQVTSRLDMQFGERLSERTRLAQDLHDTILQGCVSVSMYMHVADERLPDGSEAKPLVGRALSVIGQVIDEGRNTVSGLRSPTDAADDLEVAFARVPRELALGDESLRVVVDGRSRPLRPAIRDEVFRIGREALVNALRHAQARNIQAQLEYGARRLLVVIRDDGQGMTPEVLASGRERHWGLAGMRERAERIGAKLKVWSRPGAGTEVELSVPGPIAYLPEPAGRRPWYDRFRHRGQGQS